MCWGHERGGSWEVLADVLEYISQHPTRDWGKLRAGGAAGQTALLLVPDVTLSLMPYGDVQQAVCFLPHGPLSCPCCLLSGMVDPDVAFLFTAWPEYLLMAQRGCD